MTTEDQVRAAPPPHLPEPSTWPLGEPPKSVLDLTGQARSELLALWQSSGTTLQILACDDGRPFGSARVARGAAVWLMEQGVPRAQIRLLRKRSDVRPADLVLNLDGFGARWGRATPEDLLRTALRPGGLLISDIRKGSGAWGWLRGFGSTETLGRAGEQSRVATRLRQSARPWILGTWPEVAAVLAGPDGFVKAAGQAHSFLYVPRSRDVLIVSFDTLDLAMEKRSDRRPWGYDFVQKQGWSMLAVLAEGWTWYRDPAVYARFAELRDAGFFAQFKRVVFYGGSMGGYAAAAFSAVVPGADVVALAPQSTLERQVVPWETRYQAALTRDFTGPYGDAAVASAAARKVVIFYDPHEPLDRAHAERFTATNVLRLRAPLLGHRLGSSLAQMGLLSGLVVSALQGELTAEVFHRSLRARRDFPRYQRELFQRAVARGHVRLARHMAERVLLEADNRALRRGLAQLNKELAQAESAGGV